MPLDYVGAAWGRLQLLDPGPPRQRVEGREDADRA